MEDTKLEKSPKELYLEESEKLFSGQIQKNVDKLREYANNEHTNSIHGPGRLDGVVTGHDDRLLVLEGMVQILLNRIDVLEDGR